MQMFDADASGTLSYSEFCEAVEKVQALRKAVHKDSVLQENKRLMAEGLARFRSVSQRDGGPGGLDFSGVDLRGKNLDDIVLPIGINLRGADLSKCSLRRATLRGVDLRYSSLNGTDFSRSDLRGGSLAFAEIGMHCSFRRATMNKINLYYAGQHTAASAEKAIGQAEREGITTAPLSTNKGPYYYKRLYDPIEIFTEQEIQKHKILKVKF